MKAFEKWLGELESQKNIDLAMGNPKNVRQLLTAITAYSWRAALEWVLSTAVEENDGLGQYPPTPVIYVPPIKRELEKE